MVELSSKFGADPGEAVDLIIEAHEVGLVVEGLSFHVGSQTDEFRQLRAGPAHRRGDLQRGTAAGLREAQPAGYWRRLSRSLRRERPAVRGPRTHAQRRDRPPLPQGDRNPRRAGPLPGGHGRHCGDEDHRRALRDGKRCYYVDNGVYHTFSGIIFDHCRYRIRAFKDGASRSAPSSARPAMPWTRFPWPKSFPNWTSATCYIARTSRYTRGVVHLVQRLSAGQGPAHQPVRS